METTYKWDKTTQQEAIVEDRSIDMIDAELENAQKGLTANNEMVIVFTDLIKDLTKEKEDAIKAGFKSEKEDTA